MAPEIISQISSGFGRDRQLSDLDEIGRAATALVKAYGGNALRVRCDVPKTQSLAARAPSRTCGGKSQGLSGVGAVPHK